MVFQLPEVEEIKCIESHVNKATICKQGELRSELSDFFRNKISMLHFDLSILDIGLISIHKLEQLHCKHLTRHEDEDMFF